MPQFFKQTEKLNIGIENLRIQKLLELSKYKVESPRELIQDMSEFIREVGFHSSFLDPEEKRKRDSYSSPWKLVAKIFQEGDSLEQKIFCDNIQPIIQETEHYKHLKNRQHLKMKRRRENAKFDIDFVDPQNQTPKMKSPRKKGSKIVVTDFGTSSALKPSF